MMEIDGKDIIGTEPTHPENRGMKKHRRGWIKAKMVFWRLC